MLNRAGARVPAPKIILQAETNDRQERGDEEDCPCRWVIDRVFLVPDRITGSEFLGGEHFCSYHR